jgi:3-mercaptopyruvate sulfurtransferase SseA
VRSDAVSRRAVSRVAEHALGEGAGRRGSVRGRDRRRFRALYEAAGVTGERPVITYCNAGVSASVGLFALRMAGISAVTNYCGLPVYEWESDPGNPMSNG